MAKKTCSLLLLVTSEGHLLAHIHSYVHSCNHSSRNAALSELYNSVSEQQTTIDGFFILVRDFNHVDFKTVFPRTTTTKTLTFQHRKTTLSTWFTRLVEECTKPQPSITSASLRTHPSYSFFRATAAYGLAPQDCRASLS